MVLVLKHVRIVCHSSSLIEQFTPQCNQQEMKRYSMIDQPTNLPSFLITSNVVCGYILTEQEV